MNTCPTCSLKRELLVCNKCNVHNCKDCLDLHNPSCSTIKKQRYNLCNQHGSPVVEYCCECSKLTCNTCAESHLTHLRIPMKDAFFSIKEGISGVIDDLREKETQLKTFVENAGQKYELSTRMVEEEEKRWIRAIADVKRQILVVLDNSQLRRDRKTFLHSLDEVKTHSNVLKAEHYPLTFLSKWSSVWNWINKYEQWQTANRKRVDIESGDQSVSQMFRTQILKCVGSTTDKPLKPVKVDDIDRISEKLSGVSIDDKSHSADTGQQQPNSAIEDEHVHVPNPNDRSDYDKDRRIKELKAKFSGMEESNKQQKIQIGRLENEIKQFGIHKDKHAGLEKACHKQTIEITDLKKKLKNLQEEHTCLKNTSHQQKTQIDKLSKNRDKEEHSTLVKTCDQLKTQIGDLKQNLQSQCSEKEDIVNLISSIEQLTPEIINCKQVCKKVPLGTSANDTPKIKTCKKMMQSVMDAIVDSANNLISQGMTITIRNGKIKELVSENGKLRQQLFEHQTKQKHTDDYIQHLTIVNEMAQKRLVSLSSSAESWRLQCEDKEKKIQILQTEKDDLQTRLSSIAGDKLAKGNPAITDLSDPNRPMKISEKYGELYDNEWTDAIECTGTIRSLYPDVERSQIEEIIIHHLYKLLTLCYKECVVLSSKQLRTIRETVVTELNLEGEDKSISNIPGYEEVCKFRTRGKYAEKFAEYLVKQKVLTGRIDVTTWDYVHKNADLIKYLAVTPFFEKCVHLCWYMVIQYPIMFLSEEPVLDSKYDKDMYKEFVRSGDKVKFVVWPALFLHEGGPLLYKGVVQAYS